MSEKDKDNLDKVASEAAGRLATGGAMSQEGPAEVPAEESTGKPNLDEKLTDLRGRRQLLGLFLEEDQLNANRKRRRETTPERLAYRRQRASIIYRQHFAYAEWQGYRVKMDQDKKEVVTLDDFQQGDFHSGFTSFHSDFGGRHNQPQLEEEIVRVDDQISVIVSQLPQEDRLF